MRKRFIAATLLLTLTMMFSLACSRADATPVPETDRNQQELLDTIDQMNKEIAALKEEVEEIQNADEEDKNYTSSKASATSEPAPPPKSSASFADCLVNTTSAIRETTTEQGVVWYKVEGREQEMGVRLTDVTHDLRHGYAARSCRHLAPIPPPLWVKKGCMSKAVVYFNQRHPYYLPDGFGAYNNPNSDRPERDSLDGLFALEVCRLGQ